MWVAGAVLAAIVRVASAESTGANWPSLPEQLGKDKVLAGSALEALIKANQDFGMLRAEEAKDTIRVPPWLRVVWRKSHPEGVYVADDPTGGYPFVLKEVHEWMLSHQDLQPGVPEAHVPPGPKAGVGTNVRTSGLQTVPRSESDIRINYWNPQLVIASSNNIGGSGLQGQYYSADGGATWGQTTLGSLFTGDAFHSDPTADWTSDGKAWSSTLGIDSGGSVLKGRMYTSADNGATWAQEGTWTGTQTSVDKQMAWVDHSATSPYKDRVYVIYHNNAPAFMNRRTPGVAGTWLAAPIQVSGAESTGTCIGGDVKSNAYGDVFGFWPTTTNRRVLVVKSVNGGDSFGTPVQVATTYDGYDIGVPSFNGRRALIYVSAGAYRTAAKDMVYASWTDLSGEAGCTAAANEPGSNVASTCKTRVWFSRSTNGGATWSAPAMINNQASLNDQFNQWLAVDETSGAIALMYYDTVADAGRKKSDVWYQSSFNDGASWNAPVKVTTAQTDETTGGQDSGNQYGDYNGLSYYAGVALPVWTDRRSGLKEEIWTAKVTDAACTAPAAPTAGTATATGANQIQVTFTNGAPPSSTYKVYRAPGTCAAPTGPFVAIASNVAASPYLDTTVSGGSTYAYKVSGFEVTGICESTQSTCLEATATGACTLAPTFAGAATVTNAATASCQLDVAWSAATAGCAGPVTYNVYRSTTSGFTPGPANLVASGLTGTVWNDATPLTSGTRYYYIVRAVDSSNSVEETNSAEKSGFPTGPIAVGTFTDTFEGALSGGGFDRTGWTHQFIGGSVDWAWSTAVTANTPTHSWFSSSQTSVSDRILVSPSFIPAADSVLTFFHTFNFEGTSTCFDGGTLEVSTNAGATWTVVPDAAFTAGGFTGTVSSSFSNPIGGKRAWCFGTVGAMTQVTVNLAAYAGLGTQLRWHEGDDSSTKATGWYVDSVVITNAGSASACNTSPVELLTFSVD
jgi:hypothetical protein